MTAPGVGRVAARRQALQWPVLACLAIVWMTLWGEFSLRMAVGGLLAGIIACLVFPLPQVRLNMRVRPLALLYLIGRFLVDVVIASVQVSLVVLRPRRELRNAIIEVNLRTPSDFVLTVVAEMTCLIPGSLVIEARRSTHTLFLHVLNVPDQAAVDRFREAVLDQEARVVRALGADLTFIEAHKPNDGALR